jgi:hypothetical protein
MLSPPSLPTPGTFNNASGGGDYTTFSFPAAVGGLNRRDGKAQMPVEDANILTNVIPYPTYCAVRNGYGEYASVVQLVDFGLVTDPATETEDLGLVTQAVTEFVDLGTIV